MTRIGILQLTQHLDDAVSGFKSALAQAGYTDNVEFIYYNVEGRVSALQEYAERLILAQVQLIFACSTPAARAAIDAAAKTVTPVLFTPVFDPVGAGLIPSLTQPGGIATGASGMVPAAAKVAFLQQLLPAARHIGILVHAEDSNARLEHRLFSAAAEQAGLTTISLTVTSAGDLSRLPELLSEDMDALFLPIGKVIEENFATIQYYTDDAGLPVIASHGPNVSAGALAGLVANHKNLGMICGEMAARILKGTTVGDICVATPRQLDVLLNLGTAANLGIEISEELQQKAAELYR
jgi:putative tryptophan/tyrosine transport system substrate-binding protein